MTVGCGGRYSGYCSGGYHLPSAAIHQFGPCGASLTYPPSMVRPADDTGGQWSGQWVNCSLVLEDQDLTLSDQRADSGGYHCPSEASHHPGGGPGNGGGTKFGGAAMNWVRWYWARFACASRTFGRIAAR